MGILDDWLLKIPRKTQENDAPRGWYMEVANCT